MQIYQADLKEWEELKQYIIQDKWSFDEKSNIYYMKNLGEIFPIEIDIQSSEPATFNRRLR